MPAGKTITLQNVNVKKQVKETKMEEEEVEEMVPETVEEEVEEEKEVEVDEEVEEEDAEAEVKEGEEKPKKKVVKKVKKTVKETKTVKKVIKTMKKVTKRVPKTYTKEVDAVEPRTITQKTALVALGAPFLEKLNTDSAAGSAGGDVWKVMLSTLEKNPVVGTYNLSSIQGNFPETVVDLSESFRTVRGEPKPVVANGSPKAGPSNGAAK